MIDRKYVWCLLCLTPFLVAAIGCSEKKPDGMPPLVPCTVTVTQGGAPLANANVTLFPLDGSQWTANGSTDGSGKAVMFAWGSHQGAPVGKYKVTVAKMETDKAAVARSSSDEPSTDPPPNSYNLVEEKYGMKDSTTLEIEVVKGTTEYKVEAGAAVRELIPPKIP